MLQQLTLTREEVRNVDRCAIDDYGVPGIVLMENAGRGAAELLLALGINGSVLIICGKGNNGGDGFVIARHLELAGVTVEIILVADPVELRGDAAINFHIVKRSHIPLSQLVDGMDNAFDARLHSADWIVDALLGTGVRGSVRAPFDKVIQRINAARRNVLAVDLPSGMDCDTGDPLGCCVKANHTATFVARKRGFENPDSSQRTGKIHVIGIGAPQHLLDELC